jgi:hypothetical protein
MDGAGAKPTSAVWAVIDGFRFVLDRNPIASIITSNPTIRPRIAGPAGNKHTRLPARHVGEVVGDQEVVISGFDLLVAGHAGLLEIGVYRLSSRRVEREFPFADPDFRWMRRAAGGGEKAGVCRFVTQAITCQARADREGRRLDY